MRTRAQLTTPRLHIPLARLALCVDCEECFEIGPDTCPACGSQTWSALSRFIGNSSERAVVRAVQALVHEARGHANLMPAIMEAVKAYATLGEINQAMKRVFGEHKEPVKW